MLTPKDKIYETTISLTSMYIFITMAAIGVACIFAFFKTQHDYKYLSKIISTFSMPKAALKRIQPPSKRISNPFEYILEDEIGNLIEIYNEMGKRINDSITKLYIMQINQKQAELKMLQFQINPHFLHNTLNSIYWESVKQTGSENRCSQMISYLSAIMRYSLSDPQENVKVQNEIDYLKKYLEIMKLRYVNKFDARFHIAPECSIYPVKKMLLQPLVENAIYHGIKEKKEKGIICISVHRKKDRIYFNIYDTGNGIPGQKLDAIRRDLEQMNRASNQNIGLVNTNSRLVLSYGPDSGLHIKSRSKDFTVIWFSIPVPKETADQFPTDSI